MNFAPNNRPAPSRLDITTEGARLLLFLLGFPAG